MRFLQLLTALSLVLGLANVGSAQILNRVDFFASTNGWAQTASPNGTEAFAIAANPVAFGSSGLNVWDNRGAPGHATYGASTFSNLLSTTTGTPTGVSMSFANISAAGDAPGTALTRDYLILLSGFSDSSGYTISGLQPNTPTKLFLYPSTFATRPFNISVNGASPVTVSGNGIEVVTTASPTGQVTGTWSRINAEANWAGIQIYQPAAALGVTPVVNGSFEMPTPIAPGNNFDTVTPTGWNFTAAPGFLPYPRVGSGGFGYPAAADGTTIYAVEGDRGGTLFQDLGTMVAGETYTLDAVVSSSTGNNSYRASFIGDPLGTPLELEFVTQADFNPAAGSFLNLTMSYMATVADNGKVLRLALSDNGTTAATRTAFDNVRVSVTAAAVPEPASIVIWSLISIAVGGVALRCSRRPLSA